MDGDGSKTSKKTPVIVGTVVTVVVIVTVVIGVLLYTNNENPTGQQPEQNSSETGVDDQGTTQEPEVETEEYLIPDFVTAEMKARWAQIYREQGIDAMNDAVYQDFSDHGVKFNWGNPHHTSLLNVQEEI
jgi:predicted metalloprotease